MNLHVSAGHPISPKRLWKPLVTAMTGATLVAALGLSTGVWNPSQGNNPAQSAGTTAVAPSTTFMPAQALVGSSATPDEIAAYTPKERAVAPVSDQEMYQLWLQRAPARAVVGSSATPDEIAAFTASESALAPVAGIPLEWQWDLGLAPADVYELWLAQARSTGKATVAPSPAVVGSSATPGEIAAVMQQRSRTVYIVATEEQAAMVHRFLLVSPGLPEQLVAGTVAYDFRVLIARDENDQAISEQITLAQDWQRGLGLEPARVYDPRTP